MKKLLSKISAVVFTAAMIFSTVVNANAITKSDCDTIKAKYAILMDYESGQILYKKNADSKIYPASTTKIWTAFCVIEKAKDVNEIVEIKDMPQIEGSSMYLENGEKFTVRQLLESLLVHSSNDVGYVLAKHFGDGDEKKFIDFMNEEAARYGAKHTHFNNPHGLPDENHYTTAKDMTLLSRVAYGDKTIKEIVAMKNVTFKKNDNIKLDRNLFNSNKFLTSPDSMDYFGKSVAIKYSVVDGIKTGYTDDAGNCLVSTGEKNGMRMIAGVFFAPAGNLYHDSRTLLDYGFDNFKNEVVFDKKSLSGSKDVKFATPGSIRYSPSSEFSVTVMGDSGVNKSDYEKKLNFDLLKLPVKKGDVIGTANIYEKKKMVSSIALVAEGGSQSYIDFVLSKIPFLPKDDEKETADNGSSSDKNTESTVKKDSKSSSKGNIMENASKGVGKAKEEALNSAHGVLGMLSEVKSLFANLFSGDLSNVRNSDLYQYLRQEVSSRITFIPAKYIIFGVPLIILLLILSLIISIIKQSFGMRKERKNKRDDDEPIFNNIVQENSSHDKSDVNDSKNIENANIIENSNLENKEKNSENNNQDNINK